MEYAIKSTFINKITLSEDSLSISVGVTVNFNAKEESKMADSSIGTTIVLSLKDGERNTLAQELNSKTLEWFNENYNPKT
jgi:hypothetical protein